MKNFFKIMFASCFGSALMLIAAFIIIPIWIASSFSNDTEKVTEKSILYMDLNYDIAERSSESEKLISILKNNGNGDFAGLNDILANIRAAANDDNIKGILIETQSVGTGLASVEEIINALDEFKKSGKFIAAYSDGYSQGAYYLATVADKIYLNPDGMLEIRGMAAQLMFYKNLMEKLDVKMQIVRGPDNKYKSAVEPYFLDKMSDANRLQYSELLGAMWNNVAYRICTKRNIEIDQLNAIANSMETTFDAKKALEYGLIDGLYYRDQLIDELKAAIGCDEDDDINIVRNSTYAQQREDKTHKDKIAVIYANGSINDGEGDDNTIGSTTLSKAIREARRNDKVKAIVMRVNSPGGSALASEVIRREVELAAKEKPFIVSMGDYAASGGYWISAEADRIFADNNTLTGSIGVFGTFPSIKGLTDKVGVTFDIVKTHDNADFGTMTKELNEQQLAMLEKYVAETYDQFLTLVSRTRHMSKTAVDSIAQGRVWAGSEAVKIGLVDEIGDLSQAIKYAAAQANLKDFAVKEYPEQEDIFSSFVKNGADQYTQAELKSRFGMLYPYIKQIEATKNTTGIQAVMPFFVIE